MGGASPWPEADLLGDLCLQFRPEAWVGALPGGDQLQWGLSREFGEGRPAGPAV